MHLILSNILYSICTKYDPVSSTNKADRHDIAEILLKVALNAISKQANTKYDI